MYSARARAGQVVQVVDVVADGQRDADVHVERPQARDRGGAAALAQRPPHTSAAFSGT